MILNKLKLTNIRSYLKETIEFPEGKLLISGDIGSGKSTILLSIEFALFGIQRGQLNGETLLRNGQNTGNVELYMNLGKDEIIIHRKLKRNKDTINQAAGYIIHNGIKIEGTPIELKAKMFELMGYPTSLLTKSKGLIFRYTVYTPQEDMKKILTEDVESRLNTLRRIFNIDKYKRVKENSQILIKAIKQESALLKGRCEDLENKKTQKKILIDEQKECEKEISELEPKLKLTKDELNNARKKVQEQESKIQASLTAKKRAEELENKLKEKVLEHTHISQKIKKLEEEHSLAIKKITEKQKQITINEEDILNGIEKKRIEYEFTSKEIALKKQKETQLVQQIKELKEKPSITIEQKKNILKKENEIRTQVNGLAETKKRLIEIQEKIGELERTQYANQISIKQSKETINSISQLTNCPTCKQEVNYEHKHRITIQETEKQNKNQKTLEDNQISLQKLQEQHNQIKIKHEKQNKAERELISIKEQIKNIETQFLESEKNKEQLKKLEKELTKIKETDYLQDQNKKTTLEQELKELETQQKVHTELKLSTTKINAQEKLINEIKEQQKSIKIGIGNINKEKLESSQQAQKFNELQILLNHEKETENKIAEEERKLITQDATLKQREKDLKIQIETINDEIEKKTEYKTQSQELMKRQNWLEKMFIKLMDVIEKHVMISVHKEFSNLFTQWFEMLMQDENLQVRLNDRFTPIIIQNGYETDMNILSGGEKTSLALAYRLALNRVINELIGTIQTKELIILDEPTDGFSNFQLDNVRNVFEELPNKQIIIVSHEPKVESFVDHIIKIQKHEHISQAN